MRTRGLFGVCAVLCFLGAGCGTTPTLDVNRMMDNYYRQERTYESLSIRGASRLSIEGSNLEVVVRNEMQPLSIRSSDPSTAERVIDAVSSTAKAAAVGYFGTRVVHDLSKTRVVEQPEPTIVRPEVVEVPTPVPAP